MSKIFLIAVILVAAAIVTGVLDVKFRPERVSSAPGALVQMARSGNLVERGRALAVGTKRWFDIYSAQEESQKMEVMLGFVREDAERLEKLVSAQSAPQKIIPQAKLLAKSVEQAQEQAEKLPEGELADMKGLSEEAFEQASAALANLEQLQKDLAEGAGQLEEVANSIDVVKPEEDEGEVAGAEDEAGKTPPTEDAPQSTVPLRF